MPSAVNTANVHGSTAPSLRPPPAPTTPPAVTPSATHVWLESLKAACAWLQQCCMNPTTAIAAHENPYGYLHSNWRGAAREYSARTGHWHVFGPLWHTGQLAKALVLAHEVLGDSDLIAAAKVAGDFVLADAVTEQDDPDHGLIPAYENTNPRVSATSCMLESLDGLFHLSQATGDPRYQTAAAAALRWAMRRVYLPHDGLFLDDFDIKTRHPHSAANTLRYGVPGRPLNDDGVFLTGYRLTGDAGMREVFFGIADRLLKDERPQGNWIQYPPCNPWTGILHPRHAFWWGRPMVMAWRESGDDRYLACAHRSAQWYVQAQRSDGGMFRATREDFLTPSYGQASSGIFSAACLWRDLIVAGQGEAYRQPLRLALEFGRSMQFKQTQDPNLPGGILEKTEPPDGTDRPTFNLRDLGTIFYVQALAQALRDRLL